MFPCQGGADSEQQPSLSRAEVLEEASNPHQSKLNRLTLLGVFPGIDGRPEPGGNRCPETDSTSKN